MARDSELYEGLAESNMMSDGTLLLAELELELGLRLPSRQGEVVLAQLADRVQKRPQERATVVQAS